LKHIMLSIKMMEFDNKNHTINTLLYGDHYKQTPTPNK
jgi:hypothetical protein